MNSPEMPSVMWQGKNQDIDEIYHLLDEFEIMTIAASPTTQDLLIILNQDDQLVLHLYDTIILDKDPMTGDGRVGIQRQQAGTA